MQYFSMSLPFEEHFDRVAVPSSAEREKQEHLHDILSSSSYSLAFLDQQFIASEQARSTRIQLEMDKAEWYQRQFGIRSTVIVFGSARILSQEAASQQLRDVEMLAQSAPNNADLRAKLVQACRAVEMSQYYEQAREFARIVSENNGTKNAQPGKGPYDYVICTGGGPGIMEAGNRGAFEANAPSVGLNIKLPYEQQPNPYITPDLCFQFHYFSVRKLHFMLRAKALVACPGGFGTFDELFEALTLRQTERMQPIPVILFGEDFWRKCVHFDYLVESGVIDRDDLELFHFTDSPQEAWDIIRSFSHR